nr:uncharacterized protein CFP56_02794 [Quercus suber]
MASPEFRTFLPPAIAAKNLEVLEHGLQALRIAEKAGVTLCYGTDLLGPLHAKQSGEFALRRQAGLSPLAIIQSATVNAAMMLRAGKRLGRVKEGFCADLLVLNANPLDDISVLERPERHLLAVFKGGRVLESRWSVLPREDATLGEMIE